MHFQVVPLDGLFDRIPSQVEDSLLKGDGRFKDYYDIDDDNTDDGGFVDLNHWN